MATDPSNELPPKSTAEGSTSPPAAAKAVSIATPENISPLLIGKHKELDSRDSLDLDRTVRQFQASISGKRLSGRPSIERLSSYKAQAEGTASLTSLLSESSDLANTSSHGHHAHDNIIKQITAWLKHEKARRAARKAKRHAAKDAAKAKEKADPGDTAGAPGESSAAGERRGSDSSEGSVALEHLAHILERTVSLKSSEISPRRRRASHGHKLVSLMKRHSTVSSDTDYFESVDQLVPSCDVVLDNSKTMAYGAGGPEDGDDTTGRQNSKEKEAWATFKYEIVRLAHTLKLKGWRRVPLDQSIQIDVQRLSGALTNAVYVVSPPEHLPSQERPNGLPAPKNPPPKLLLRIYGPQVEHLIDREAELQILRRLARKRIGPRLLGTFSNGRFEEFFHAKPLTPRELRIPETSKQIAKRMRELHEGIDLLKKEREAGPFVWRNWDKWVNRCEQIVTWLDQQIAEGPKPDGPLPPSDRWRERGYVCGMPWPIFRQLIEKYRAWLVDQYGGLDKVNERLVFAHNDTQYGNILRMIPAGESPLLLPANEHKQLVVIDFEYANANLPGLEFANHFTEWCYNYHDAEFSWRFNASWYPTPEEQARFIRAYLMHNPTFKAPGGSASNPPTPHFGPLGPLGPLPSTGSTCALTATATPTTISAFMLDSRAPPGEKKSYQDLEAQAERQVEEECRRLMAETKLWRLANSAMWTAWGIVQAHVPGIPDFEAQEKQKKQESSEQEVAEKPAGSDAAAKETKEVGSEKKDPNEPPAADEQISSAPSDQQEAQGDESNDAEEEQEEEFDYLSYANDRAMFLWGDALNLGIVKAEELPEGLLKRVKLVEN